jgi:endonuclease/exonuclease/phosphatase (EEP) superfamily protein YafD
MGFAARAFVMNGTHRVKLVRDFRYIIGLIAVCSLIGLFEPLFPLFDLFNHFRLQAIIGAFVCVLICFCLRDKRGIVVCLIVLLLNAGIIGARLYEIKGVEAIGQGSTVSMSVIAFNVLTSNTRYTDVISMIEKENADVVIFFEVDQIWAEQLSALEGMYAHSLKHPRPDNFGIIAFSKKPFAGDVQHFDGKGVPALFMTLDDIVIIGAHPVPPVIKSSMEKNRTYLMNIADMVDKNSQKPVLIAGDLNATLWSAAITPLIDAGFMRVNSYGFAYTWPQNNPALALQIDHFFGRNVVAADFRTLPSTGSDHSPIRADIVLPLKN